ncbi:polysaccharide deacetylase family protein [Actinomyces culturomici]|uniref:polysaccharide deacetylase family protein n=1 Tax=Actinomyces culturomici TaxID=1926276 RepID=UPI000E201026|nr:polysaccharide deacetylase family protein [Actinomyces culturomici]
MIDRDTTVIIGVDMETDVGSFTPYYEGVRNGTPRLLELFDELGISATFLFTGACAKQNPEVARECVRRGHEVGAHSLEHETVGDPLFALPGERTLLPHEVFPRLEMNTRILEKVVGERPVSFRCPRLWGSTAVVRALDKLGYIADLTYPMYFYREHFAPYFASLDDWTREGDSRVLEIPNFADMVMESRDPGLERDRDQWPLFRTRGGEYMYERSSRFADFCSSKGIPTVLCYYIHPWEFWTMEDRYNFGEATVIPDRFITENCGDVALEQLKIMLSLLLADGAQVTTARDFSVARRS